MSKRFDLGGGEQGEGGNDENRLERRGIYGDSMGNEVEEGNEGEAEEYWSYYREKREIVDWFGYHEALSLPALV